MQSRLTVFSYVRISDWGFCATVETCDPGMGLAALPTVEKKEISRRANPATVP
jgi:hypothetical protein